MGTTALAYQLFAYILLTQIYGQTQFDIADNIIAHTLRK